MCNDTKPDYEFDAYLKRQGSPDVLCDMKILLPRNASEDMRISLFAPGRQDADSVFSQDTMMLKSETYQKSPTFDVVASGVRLKQVQAQLDMRKASGTSITLLHIAELTIGSKISSDSTPPQSKNEETISSLLFHLSDLKYATSEAFVTPDYLGNRKVEISKIYAVNCSDIENNNGKFLLEKHYSYWQKHGLNKESVYSRRVMVWQGNDSTNVDNIPSLLKLADDVGLLLTLAARHRVMVLGYEYTTQHHSFKQFRSPLKRNRIEREETGRDQLIQIGEFEEFMQTAIAKWRNSSNEGKDCIRLAIVALHPLTELSAQRDYLAMFAALEGLSKLHKGKVASELEEVWTDIQSSLSECIDNQSSISHDAQDFLKNNLSVLKQGKKLETRMKEFFKSLNVHLDDLWPVFGNAKHPSLYWARNELAHGRHFNDGRFGTFLKAEEHLRLTLERVVLCMLGFDPNRTTAGIQSLHNQGRRLTHTQLESLRSQLLQQ
ncbi:MAG: hypothetical protein WC742_04435 [Gallionellaceae bacterium]|jgi:hypothetical protein